MCEDSIMGCGSHQVELFAAAPMLRPQGFTAFSDFWTAIDRLFFVIS